jgi:hypothetical protein
MEKKERTSIKFVFLNPMNTKKNKFILLGLLSIFSIQGAIAQKGFRAGFSLLPNISRPILLDSLPANFDREYTPGLGFGITAQYGINDGISFFVSALYSSKGYKVTNDTNSLNKSIKGNTQNLEIPFGFYLKQNVSRQNFVRETVGFGLNYNLASESTYLFRSQAQNPFALESVMISRLNTMLSIGVEFGHTTEAGHIFTAGIVYRHGIGKPTSLNIINNTENQDRYFEMGYNGSYLGLQMNFLFNFKDIKPMKGELFFE